MTNPSSMNEAGHSKLVLWDNPDGQDGEEGGRGFSAILSNRPTLVFSHIVQTKVCSLHLGLFRRLAYTVIIPVFLNPVYMR